MLQISFMQNSIRNFSNAAWAVWASDRLRLQGKRFTSYYIVRGYHTVYLHNLCIDDHHQLCVS